METVNVHEAKTNLSRLIDAVTRGGRVIIAKAGKPVAKLIPLDAPEGDKVRRLGFLTGRIKVPSDFDRMGSEEIDELFSGRS